MTQQALTSFRSWSRTALALTGIVLAAACSQPPPPPAPATPATPASPPVKSADARVQWYQDCWGYFNGKDWEKFGLCYDENAVSENIGATPPSVTGRAAIVERDKKEAETFPDRKGNVALVLGNGARLLSVAFFTGTNSGPMMGADGKEMPATNKKVGFYLAHVADLDASGASVARDAVYADDGTTMAQLGVVKNPMARKATAPPSAATTVVVAKNDDKERANLATVQTLIDAGNKHDVKAIEALMADDYKLMENGQPKDMNKKEAIASSKEFMAAFPDAKMTPAHNWAAGDYVVLEGSLAGTNSGPLPSMGITKATGKSFDGRFIEVLKIDNGKIKEDWLFYNGAQLMSQLGLK